MPGKAKSDATFFNVAHGAISNKKQSYYSYTARLVALSLVEDKYEDQIIWKWKLVFDDDGQKINIGFNAETWYAMGFWARATKIDFTKPFELGVSQSEKNEKISFCWIKQEDAIVKKDDDFPRPVDVKVGGKTVKDYTPVWAEVEPRFQNIVDNHPRLNFQIQANAPMSAREMERIVEQPKQEEKSDEPKKTDKEDDLPF